MALHTNGIFSPFYFHPFLSSPEYCANSEKTKRTRQLSLFPNGMQHLGFQSFKNDNTQSYTIGEQSIKPHSSSQEIKNPSSISYSKTDGISIIREKFKRLGLSSSLVDMLLKGWRKSTLQQYNVYLKKWITFCEQNKQKPLKRNKFLVLKFLKRLFK